MGEPTYLGQMLNLWYPKWSSLAIIPYIHKEILQKAENTHFGRVNIIVHPEEVFNAVNSTQQILQIHKCCKSGCDFFENFLFSESWEPRSYYSESDRVLS